MISYFAFSRPPTSSQVTFFMFSTFSMLTSFPIYFKTCYVYILSPFLFVLCRFLIIFENVTHPRLLAANFTTSSGSANSICSFLLQLSVTLEKILILYSLFIQKFRRFAFLVMSNLIEFPLKPMIRMWLVNPLSPKLKNDSSNARIILFIFSCSSFFSFPTSSNHSMFLMQMTVELKLSLFLIFYSNYPSLTKYLQLILTKEQSWSWEILCKKLDIPTPSRIFSRIIFLSGLSQIWFAINLESLRYGGWVKIYAYSLGRVIILVIQLRSQCQALWMTSFDLPGIKRQLLNFYKFYCATAPFKFIFRQLVYFQLSHSAISLRYCNSASDPYPFRHYLFLNQAKFTQISCLRVETMNTSLVIISFATLKYREEG